MPQFRLIREATRAFNLPCIEQAGFEADDIIATYATQAAAAGGRVTIVSADKDLMQLVSPGIEMFDTLKNKTIGPDEVFEKFGVGPDRVIDVQALAGDSVDNVPGAPGIGIKTAAQLIQEYGDLDTLLERADEIRQPKRREVLHRACRADPRLARRWSRCGATCRSRSRWRRSRCASRTPTRCSAGSSVMEFRALSGRVAAKLGVAAPVIDAEGGGGAGAGGRVGRASRWRCRRSTPPAPSSCATPAALADVGREDSRPRGGGDRRRDHGARRDAGGAGRARALRRAGRGGVPAGRARRRDPAISSSSAVEGQVPLEAALALLKPMLEDPAVLKIGQNIKASVKYFARYGIALAPIDDTMLVSFVLHSGQHGHGLEYLADTYLNHLPIDAEVADRRRPGGAELPAGADRGGAGAASPSMPRWSGGCGRR